MHVLIVDDHPLLRRAIGEVIQGAFTTAVIREVSTGAEALRMMSSEPISLAIVDILLPDQNGLTVLRKIKQLHPQTKCVILTIRDDPWYVRYAMKHGASGYLMKGAAVDELRQAIQTVVKGGCYVSEALASAVDGGSGRPSSVDGWPSLSARELEVLILLAKGRTASQVATQLKLSVKTVSTYRVRLLEKLGLQTTADLIRYALDHSLVQ